MCSVNPTLHVTLSWIPNPISAMFNMLQTFVTYTWFKLYSKCYFTSYYNDNFEEARGQTSALHKLLHMLKRYCDEKIMGGRGKGSRKSQNDSDDSESWNCYCAQEEWQQKSTPV
jgi:hypothetical protein